MVGLVLGAIIGGWLADRFGRKPVLLAATVLFGLCSLATSLAHSYEGLMFARIATGLGLRRSATQSRGNRRRNQPAGTSAV